MSGEGAAPSGEFLAYQAGPVLALPLVVGGQFTAVQRFTDVEDQQSIGGESTMGAGKKLRITFGEIPPAS